MHAARRQPKPLRFTTLLLVFMLLFVMSAVSRMLGIEAQGLVPRLLVTVTLVALVASAAFSVDASHKSLVTARILSVITALLFAARLLSESTALDLASHLAAMAFFAWTIFLILRALFAATKVDYDTISASLCVYLMFGLLWAIAYSLVYLLDDGAFRMVSADDQMVLAGGHSVNVIYFSFVTLSTLGYGDVTPLSDPARILAMLEAVIGQLFLVVLVARLVGLQVARAPTE